MFQPVPTAKGTTRRSRNSSRAQAGVEQQAEQRLEQHHQDQDDQEAEAVQLAVLEPHLRRQEMIDDARAVERRDRDQVEEAEHQVELDAPDAPSAGLRRGRRVAAGSARAVRPIRTKTRVKTKLSTRLVTTPAELTIRSPRRIIAELPGDHRDRLGATEGELPAGGEPEDRRHQHRQPGIDVRQRIERQPAQHVRGVVTLPEGRVPVGIFMRHQGEDQHRQGEDEVSQEGSSRRKAGGNLIPGGRQVKTLGRLTLGVRPSTICALAAGWFSGPVPQLEVQRAPHQVRQEAPSSDHRRRPSATAPSAASSATP